MTKKIKIVNSWIINPFFYYTLFWSVALILYSLSPSKLNLPLDEGLLVFLLVTIFFASLLSIGFNFYFKNKCYVFAFYPQKKLVTFILMLLYVADFCYSKTIPMFNGAEYMNFGIPTIHVFIVTFSIYYAVKNYFQFLFFKKRECFVNFLIVDAYFALIFSRGILMFILFSAVALTLVDKTIKVKHLILVSFLVVLGCWIFGITGNIRSGAKWNDSGMILRFAQIDFEENSIMAPFFWVEEYLICSLRNLNYNIVLCSPNFSLLSNLYNILPDFIAKRVLPQYATKHLLVFPGFTTCTMYTNVYHSFGFLGMVLNYFIYILMTFIFRYIHFADKSNRIIGFAMMSFIFALSMFDDMLRYSGYSFALIYCLIMGIAPNLRRIIPKLKWKRSPGVLR